jgi:CheY-like chemotaxis protein
MNTSQWREDDDGTFVAELSRFRLRVRRIGDRRGARFMVLRRHPKGAPALIASGTTDGLGEAMNAAEKTALRLCHADRLYDKCLIIVVSDDETVRAAVADTLEDDGYDVAQAASGEGALRRLERTNRPTLLLSDVHLGVGMSGLELAREVQTLRLVAGVLLMTGDPSLDDDVRSDGYLRKPFSTVDLLAAVVAASQQYDLLPPSRRPNGRLASAPRRSPAPHRLTNSANDETSIESAHHLPIGRR